MSVLLYSLAFIILAPLAGGILSGLDRVLTARMQGRVGPPVLQPFYDVLKLFQKEHFTVNKYHSYYLICFIIFLIFSGCLFFTGQDILLVIFAFTLADIFLVLAAYSTNSPYSFIGAERELIQMVASEPMLLVTAVAIFMVPNMQSFNISDIVAYGSSGKAASAKPLIVYLPGVFLGLLFILTIKLRKSPFDIATSHHAHQELVKGLTTEFAGPSLAIFELAHWYEVIVLMGFVFLFFSSNIVVGVVVAIAAYLLEVLIDNTCARLRWQLTWGSAWLVTIIFGGGNLLALYFIYHISRLA